MLLAACNFAHAANSEHVEQCMAYHAYCTTTLHLSCVYGCSGRTYHTEPDCHAAY